MPDVLTIAGSDPGGGAGLARDVDTIARLGGSARIVVTAVTAQTNRTVSRIACLPPELVAAQFDAALCGGRAQAIKIGMLGSAAIVEVLAKRLAAMDDLPIVLDPVLAASSGTALIDRAGREAMIEKLLPLTRVLAPNLPEAAVLTGLAPASTEADIARQAQALLDLGASYVLMKGGHGNDAEAVDLLYSRHRPVRRLAAPRRPGGARGTGCALASAIATFIAAGDTVEKACHRAKTFVLNTRFRAKGDSGSLLANQT